MSSSARLRLFLLFLSYLSIHPPLFAGPAAFAAASGFFTTSDGVKLHYLEAGQGDALLFIPGWLMPADIWEPQFRELSRDHHVLALDPRSQGLSDMTSLGDDPLRRSRDIAEWMDHLRVGPVVLVGWALGAFDCLAYLRQFGPDQVRALVLVESPLGAPEGLPNPVPTRSPFLRRFQGDPASASADYVRGLFKKPPPKGLLQKLLPAAARVPADIALSTLDNIRPGEIWQPNLSLWKRIPILYAVTPAFAAQASYLKGIAPQARIETFDGSGRALFVDDADRFNTILRDFLRQASLATPVVPKKKHRPSPSASPSPGTTPSIVLPTPTKWATHTPIPIRPKPSVTWTPVPIPPTQSPTDTGSPAPPTPVPTPDHRTFLLPVPTETPRLVLTRPKPSGKIAVTDGTFTTDDHVQLHYLESGRGLPIVFIPGWILPAEIWRPQLEGLADDFHVIALDPRSQGDSQMTHQGNDPIRQAHDIQELLDHLKLGSVVLVGWSHGAFQVLAYEGQFGTDRLYAVALVDSPLAPATAGQAFSGSRQRFLKNFQADHANAVRSFVWGLFKNHPPVDFSKKLVQAASRTPPDIALALMNNAFPGDAWLPSLQVMRLIPMLYAVTPKYNTQAQYLTEVDPLARVEFFNNSGHALFVDEPDHFNEAMREFLRQAAVYPAGLPARTNKK